MFNYKDVQYYDIVRKNIKKYRIEKKYTQLQLAVATDLSVEYICEIESLTDLFHNGITCFGDILRLIKKLKYKGIKELEYKNNKYSLKRIYGLINSADTFYEADNFYFNPKYPIDSLLLSITNTLDRELYWEEHYDKIDEYFL